MGKLFWQISTSLDGFMEEPDGSLKRTAGVNDPEFERYTLEMLQSIDAFVIGRKTYMNYSWITGLKQPGPTPTF